MMWDAIVIGAGCAGLSAATRLSEEGLKVLVLERRPLLGGRASSFQDAVSGETIDNGQHLFLGCYEETKQYLDRIGTRSLLHFDDSFASRMVGPGGEFAVLRAASLPAPLHLGVGLLRYSALGWKDRWGTFRVARSALRTDDQRSSVSVSQWMDQLKQSETTQRRLWDPLVLATLNIEPNQAPADLFATVLRDGFMQSREASKPGLARVGLSDLHGNPSKVFIEKRGGEVRLRTSVTRFVWHGQQVEGVELADGTIEKSTMVICAVPPPVARKLAQGTPLEKELSASELLRPSCILSLHVWTKESPFTAPFVGFWDRPFHWAFRKSAIFQNPDVKHISMVISSASQFDGKTKSELTQLAEDDLSLAAGRTVKIERAVIVKEHEATWIPPLSSSRSNSRPRATTSISNLFLAGDWTDTGLPCTIEGAVKSGHRAASVAAAFRHANAQRAWRSAS